MITETATQLAWERARDVPNETDIRDAIQLVATWQIRRVAAGLPPYEGVIYPWEL